MLKNLEVDTVDGFQGKEKELIIFSAVRSNTSVGMRASETAFGTVFFAQGDVGFLVDGRRMNVMLTRARRGLIILADPSTLEAEQTNWRLWLEWATTRKAVITSDQLRDYLGLSHPEPMKAEEASRAVLEGRVRHLWSIAPPVKLRGGTAESLVRTSGGTSPEGTASSDEDDGWA